MCRSDIRIGFDFINICDKVHVLGSDDRLLIVVLGAEIHYGEEHQREVICHEGILRPVALEENTPTTELHTQD